MLKFTLKGVFLLLEIRKKSVIPIYGAAGAWFLYCLFFPLYSWFHFLFPAVLSLAAYIILSKLFPGTVEYVEAPKDPVKTGDEKIDALLKEGRDAVSEMERLEDLISNTVVKAKIGELISVTDKIFDDLVHDRSDYAQISRFASYYLPTTIKLLNAYHRMSSQGIEGENITSTLNKIESILDTTVSAYKKQLDSLFADQALDIETDITVMESMLKREGLSGKDF